MKVWFAGNTGTLSREHVLHSYGVGRLYSYHYVHIDFFNVGTLIQYCMTNKIDLFLDSGAFSAKSQGLSIDIDAYIAFIKEHEHLLTVYANLDVIGNPIASARNLKKMEAAGLKPLPVFHHGSDPDEFLVPLLEKYDYICLGGLVKTSDLVLYLDRIWSNYLVDSTGLPKVKVHAFGMTSLPLMLRYPWYSVDSTSWVLTGRLGSIMIPRYKGGEWVYDENSWKIAVSNRSPNQKDAGKHITTLTPVEKSIFMNYIHEKGFVLGKSRFEKRPITYDELKPGEKWAEKKPVDKSIKTRLLEIIEEPGLSNNYVQRDELNIIYFLDLEQNMPEWPWAFHTKKVMKGFFE